MPGPLPIDDLEHILSQTRDLWEELHGKRLFISGGTGFFGQWLLESFALANERLELGAEATILTRNAAAFAQIAPHLAARGDIHFHSGDVRDFPFPRGPFHAVVHVATQASAKLNVDDPLLMLDTIVAGTRRMLDFTVQCEAKKFLLTSSGAIYGAQPMNMDLIPEDYPGAPDSASPSAAYGVGKRAAEALCHIYSRRHWFAVKIARCFAFVGPGLPLDSHFAIGNFIRDTMADEPIAIHGDGTALRSYLYAGDLTTWLWKILFAGTSGRPYNVGSAEAVSIAETAEAVRRALGRKNPITVAQKAAPGQSPARYVPDVNRAASELGLKPEVALDDAIRKTARWHGWQNSF